MTFSAKGNHVAEFVCILVIVECPYRFNMVDIRLLADFIFGLPAYPALMIVAVKCIMSDGPPVAIINGRG